METLLMNRKNHVMVVTMAGYTFRIILGTNMVTDSWIIRTYTICVKCRSLWVITRIATCMIAWMARWRGSVDSAGNMCNKLVKICWYTTGALMVNPGNMMCVVILLYSVRQDRTWHNEQLTWMNMGIVSEAACDYAIVFDTALSTCSVMWEWVSTKIEYED